MRGAGASGSRPGRGFHHLVECRAVAVGGPDLEAVFLVAAERLGVGDQRLQARGGHGRTNHSDFGVERIQQELKRGQSLLSVDDRPLLQIAGRRGQLLQDDGTQEVRGLRRVRRLQQPRSYALQILPERLPLQLLVPDVGALEERNQKPLGLHEDGLWGSYLGIQWCLDSIYVCRQKNGVAMILEIPSLAGAERPDIQWFVRWDPHSFKRFGICHRRDHEPAVALRRI